MFFKYFHEYTAYLRMSVRVQNVQRAAELRHPRHLLSCTSRVTSTHVADLKRDVIMTVNYLSIRADMNLREVSQFPEKTPCETSRARGGGSLTSFVFKYIT